MELFYEKMYQVRNIRKCFDKILSAGDLIHTVVECQKECNFKFFLVQLKDLVDNIDSGEIVNSADRFKFIEIAANHLYIFIIIDQIIRKFRQTIYNLDVKTLKVAVYFEYKKIKSYLKVVHKIEKLRGQLTVLEKTFS